VVNPKIVEAIVAGEQIKGASPGFLLTADLPMDLAEQELLLDVAN
jgi:hypothetical protein